MGSLFSWHSSDSCSPIKVGMHKKNLLGRTGREKLGPGPHREEPDHKRLLLIQLTGSH